MQLKKLFLILFILFTGCIHEVHNYGVDDIEEIKSSIKLKEDTKESIEDRFGIPSITDPNNKNVWYYTQLIREGRGIAPLKTTKHKILKITFNNDGTVQNILLEDIKNIKVRFKPCKVKTGGRQEGYLKDIFGQIGQV